MVRSFNLKPDRCVILCHNDSYHHLTEDRDPRSHPGGRGKLELELLWASTSGTRTELASGLLLDLETLAGLLPLHAMRQTWTFAWVSCPHQILREFGGGPCPPYIVWGVGLHVGSPTVDRISLAVLRGVSHEGRLIGRDVCNQEQEGNRDTRVR